jgi:hypothetical protein
MAGWSVSPILVPLIREVKAEHPGIVVGTIGDPDHQAEVSDHNPDQWDFVCAGDFMLGAHFTAADAEHLFQRLRALRDPRIAYVIYNRRIFSRTVSPWKVRAYTEDDPHTGHLHISVVHGSNPHPTTSWNIYPAPLEDDMPTAEEVADLTVSKLLGKTLGSSGPNVGQDLERAENIERVLLAVQADVAEMKTKVDQLVAGEPA